MIKNILTESLEICIKSAIEVCPEIEKYNTIIRWGDGNELNKKNRAGEITIWNKKKKAIIELNPFQDYIDVLQTLRHELSHLIQHQKGLKLKHNKKFLKILSEVDKEWYKLMRRD